MELEEEKPSQWAPLLRAVGLPEKISEIDDRLAADRLWMPIEEFRDHVKIPGSVVGYDFPGVCLAGSAVLAWVTSGSSHDHDYFPVSIEAAQRFAGFLLDKGYELTGFQGARDVIDASLGEEGWEPDPYNIKQWYSMLGNENFGRCLPEPLDPLGQLPPTELVRALNFKRDGDPMMRQIVLVIRGTPREVINTFDFSVSQWAIYNGRIHWGKWTIPTMVRNRVRINQIHHPLSTMRRMLKYADKGYYFCSGTMLEISKALAGFATTREEHGLPPLDNQAISLD